MWIIAYPCLNQSELERMEGDMVKDPVCGMDVDPKNAAGKSEYQGQTYYFCSLGCKKDFDKEPQKYVKAKDSGS
jgi:YHS domain-containing protein